MSMKVHCKQCYTHDWLLSGLQVLTNLDVPVALKAISIMLGWPRSRPWDRDLSPKGLFGPGSQETLLEELGSKTGKARKAIWVCITNFLWVTVYLIHMQSWLGPLGGSTEHTCEVRKLKSCSTDSYPSPWKVSSQGTSSPHFWPAPAHAEHAPAVGDRSQAVRCLQ